MTRMALWLLLLLAWTSLRACSNAGAPSATSWFEVAVAPLDTVPNSIGDACYELEIKAQGGPIAHIDEVCSSDYGNGRGSLTYLVPCDASTAADTNPQVPGVQNQVTIWPTLYDHDENELEFWSDPCGALGCTLEAECNDSEDTRVSFDLVVMRGTRIGFFDIAVNFHELFCSAKVDCAYDAEGEEPIRLLYDPETGEELDTLVAGLSCRDGAGKDTTLYMSDLRIICDDDEPPFVMAESVLTTCKEDGSLVYGGLFQAVGSSMATASLKAFPFVWKPDVEGYWKPELTTVTSTVPGWVLEDEVIGLPLWELKDDVNGSQVLGVVGRLGSNLAQIFLEVVPGLFEENANGEWVMTAVIPNHPDNDANLSRPLKESPVDEYLIFKDEAALGVGAGSEPFVTIAMRQSGAAYAYGPQIHLRRPSTHLGPCDDWFSTGSRYVVMSCENSQSGQNGQPDLLVWDLMASPNVAPGALGPGLDPEILSVSNLPLYLNPPPAVSPTVKEFQNVGSIRTNSEDYILGRVILTTGGDNYGKLVVFGRSHSPSGSWTLLPAFPAPGVENLVFFPPQYTSPESLNTWTGTEQVLEYFDAQGVSHAYAIGDIRDQSGNTRRAAVAFGPSGLMGFASLPPNENEHFGFLDSSHRYYVASFSSASKAYVQRLDAVNGVMADRTELPIPNGSWQLRRLLGLEGDRSDAGTQKRLLGTLRSPEGNAMLIEWRLSENSAGFLELSDWFVYAPTEPIPYVFGEDWLWGVAESGNLAGPRTNGMFSRCDAVVSDFRRPVLGGDEKGLIVWDPALDQAALGSVMTRVPIAPSVGSLDGTYIRRAEALPGVGLTDYTGIDLSSFLLNPAPGYEGNVFTEEHPKPENIGSAVKQYATYFGKDELTCGSESCNAAYWNVAIAYDKTRENCRLEFEATASETGFFNATALPIGPGGGWPVFRAWIPLTGEMVDGKPIDLCGQFPLGSPNYSIDYDWSQDGPHASPFCYAFDSGTGEAPYEDPSCPYQNFQDYPVQDCCEGCGECHGEESIFVDSAESFDEILSYYNPKLCVPRIDELEAIQEIRDWERIYLYFFRDALNNNNEPQLIEPASRSLDPNYSFIYPTQPLPLPSYGAVFKSATTRAAYVSALGSVTRGYAANPSLFSFGMPAPLDRFPYFTEHTVIEDVCEQVARLRGSAEMTYAYALSPSLLSQMQGAFIGILDGDNPLTPEYGLLHFQGEESSLMSLKMRGEVMLARAYLIGRTANAFSQNHSLGQILVWNALHFAGEALEPLPNQGQVKRLMAIQMASSLLSALTRQPEFSNSLAIIPMAFDIFPEPDVRTSEESELAHQILARTLLYVGFRQPELPEFAMSLSYMMTGIIRPRPKCDASEETASAYFQRASDILQDSLPELGPDFNNDYQFVKGYYVAACNPKALMTGYQCNMSEMELDELDSFIQNLPEYPSRIFDADRFFYNGAPALVALNAARTALENYEDCLGDGPGRCDLLYDSCQYADSNLSSFFSVYPTVKERVDCDHPKRYRAYLDAIYKVRTDYTTDEFADFTDFRDGLLDFRRAISDARSICGY